MEPWEWSKSSFRVWKNYLCRVVLKCYSLSNVNLFLCIPSSYTLPQNNDYPWNEPIAHREDHNYIRTSLREQFDSNINCGSKSCRGFWSCAAALSPSLLCVGGVHWFGGKCFSRAATCCLYTAGQLLYIYMCACVGVELQLLPKSAGHSCGIL